MNSNGRYIALLDDDDEWTKDKIEEQIKVISTSEKIGLVYQNYINIDKNGKEKIVVLREYREFSDLLKLNIIGGTSMPMIRRECFDKVGMFDETLKSSQDYDMWLRIASEYEIKYINKALVKYYYTDDAITRNIEKRLQGWNCILKKNAKSYENNRYAYNYFLNIIVYELTYNGNYGRALEYLKRALKIKFLSVNNAKIFVAFLRRINKKIKG